MRLHKQPQGVDVKLSTMLMLVRVITQTKPLTCEPEVCATFQSESRLITFAVLAWRLSSALTLTTIANIHVLGGGRGSVSIPACNAEFEPLLPHKDV